MMSQKQAAEYFVVAWVKEWTMSVYLHVIGAGEVIPFEQAHALYSWLPKQWPFRPLSCRTYLAEVNRPLSDALWDAADDRARLALATNIAAFVFTKRHRGYAMEARRDYARDKATLDKIQFLKQEMKVARQLEGGHHWSVCK